MTTFGFDPVGEGVQRILLALSQGTGLPSRAEYKHVDLKEEAGRRDQSGQVLPGTRTNERAAQRLFAECACLANTDGSGALVLGVANDGTLIGTDLDVEWLRGRLYDLSHRTLTVDVSSVDVAGVRLLVIRPPQAVEPIRCNNKITWRIEDRCVEVDAATWHARRMIRTHFDWSAQASPVPASSARAQALEIARDFLTQSGEGAANELAVAPDAQLLRRLNAVDNDGYLTNAGALLFVGRGRQTAGLDYIRRDVAGGDTVSRVRLSGRSVLEELAATFNSLAAYNPLQPIRSGLVTGQERKIPERVIREAVVNGIAHREWGLPDPTVIEHVGATLRVTSPGGFFGGVTEHNIITHPSQSRNRALTELLRALRVAEREGIGVDRMTGDMLRLGYEPPSIHEVSGPFVRASLVADVMDSAWVAWLRECSPQEIATDLNTLLLLRHLVHEGWADSASAAPILQLDRLETRAALMRLQNLTIGGQPIVLHVDGVPSEQDPAFHLSSRASKRLYELDAVLGHRRSLPRRDVIAAAYARHRGRISSTELASLVYSQGPNVVSVLKDLEDSGTLRPAFPSRRGRGFHYLWAGEEPHLRPAAGQAEEAEEAGS